MNNSEVLAQFFNELTSLVYMLIFNNGFVRAVEVGLKDALSRNPSCKTVGQSPFTGNDNIKESVLLKDSLDFGESQGKLPEVLKNMNRDDAIKALRSE